MTIEHFFQWIDKEIEPQFRQKHKREIEELVCYHLHLSWSELTLKKTEKISDEYLVKIKTHLKRLVSGEPLAYIIGEKFFYKSLFKVTEDVLIPRSETEILVERALQCLSNKGETVIDLGTGSGCIGLSIAKERPENHTILIDASQKALSVAVENSQLLKLNNCSFERCEIGVDPLEWLDLKNHVDLIVSNPPYIEKGDSRVESRVHNFEPHQALYAPEKGLFWIHKFLLWGYDYLKVDGFFIFEFGQNQESEIEKIIKTSKYQIVEIIKDYCGVNRFFKLKK